MAKVYGTCRKSLQIMLTEKLYPKFKAQVETTLVLLDEILRMLYSLMKSLRN